MWHSDYTTLTMYMVQYTVIWLIILRYITLSFDIHIHLIRYMPYIHSTLFLLWIGIYKVQLASGSVYFCCVLLCLDAVRYPQGLFHRTTKATMKIWTSVPHGSTENSSPFYWHISTLIPLMLGKHSHYKPWDEINYPRCRWSLGMDKWFHPALYKACAYLSMLWLKLIHVCKRGPR